MIFKKKMKKILALSMAAVMSLSLAACGGGKTEEKAENTAQTTEGKPDTWIADRTITCLVFQSAGDAGEGSMSPEIAAYIKERTGITFEIQSVSNEDSTQALAAGLASGDLPDVIAFYLNNSGRPEFPLLLKASNEGMFADISEYLKAGKTYGKYFEDGFLPTDTKKNIMMREDQNSATYLVHMAINRQPADPGNKTVGGMYIRQDIVDDLGIDPLKINTSEQITKLLQDIKAKGYKDNNGNPITPLGPTSWGGSDRAWPYNDLIWQGPGAQKFWKDGDRVKHESMTDYAQKRVDLVHQWMKEGLMHPEYYTMEETRAQEGITNASFGIIADTHNYRPEIQNLRYTPLGPINRVDGSSNMVMPYKSGYAGWAVPSTTENPEEVVKFADWLAGPEGKLLYFYGLEGVHYDMVDGKPVPKADLVKLKDENPEEANKEGFRGVRAWWGEHLGFTDMDNMADFGERAWGDKVRGEEATAAQKIIEAYGYDERYNNKEVIDGLYPRAYLFEFEGDGGKLSAALDKWDEDLMKAYYSTPEEAKAILEDSAKNLKNSGIEDFCKFLEEKEKAGDVIFY